MNKEDKELYKFIIENSGIYVHKTTPITFFFQKGNNINKELYTSKEIKISDNTVLFIGVYLYNGVIVEDNKEDIINEYRNVLKQVKNKKNYNVSMKFHIYNDKNKSNLKSFKLPEHAKDPNNDIIVVKYFIEMFLNYEVWED